MTLPLAASNIMIISGMTKPVSINPETPGLIHAMRISVILIPTMRTFQGRVILIQAQKGDAVIGMICLDCSAI